MNFDSMSVIFWMVNLIERSGDIFWLLNCWLSSIAGELA